eukprot:gene4375-5920_t
MPQARLKSVKFGWGKVKKGDIGLLEPEMSYARDA